MKHVNKYGDNDVKPYRYISSYKYDEARRLKDTIMYLNTQLQRTYSYGYDSLGRNNTVTDRNGRKTSYT